MVRKIKLASRKIKLENRGDSRGQLTVIENLLPFEIKRIYYMYDMPTNTARGGHRHKKTRQALICIRGQCTMYIHDGLQAEEYFLNDPNVAVLLEPEDWHAMHSFSSDCMILVLSSENYDADDYITEAYD